MWVDKEFKKLTKEVMEYFREHRDEYPIIDSFDSKAKGDENDLRKLLIAIGLSINAKGKINDVIARSGAEGLTPTQFFNYTSQAIVSQYKKSRETAAPGYLIRQLNTIMAGVRLSKTKDCGTKGRLSVKILNKDMLLSMKGKLSDDGVLGPERTELIGKTIKLRSSLYCKSKDGICHNCYNPDFIEKMNLHTNAGIGLLSSTAQASMLTNMTLKAAHTGLSLDKTTVDLTQDIFEFSE
jgi:DNA-directed RNA polymerase subunit beta'